MAERTVIIGDVHGCADELEALLKQVGAGRGDALVFVGDYVAKGPDSERVVQIARAHGARGVLGNHDVRVLEYKTARDAGQPLPAIKPHHRQVLDTLSTSSWAYLQALPYVLQLSPDRLVVHAGLVPGVPLAQQTPRDMVTMRSLKPDGTASKKISDGVAWAPRWPGPQEVVFGHDAVRGLQMERHALGLDTGCCYGRELTAYLLPERRLVSVRAKRVYSQPKGLDL